MKQRESLAVQILLRQAKRYLWDQGTLQMLSFNFIAVLTTALLLLRFLTLGQRYTKRERKLYKLDGKSLLGNVTAVRKVKDILDCSFLCLKYGPFACLSYNFERSNDNGFHSCELSSSERYLEPHKMQERNSYDYYGTTTEV